MFCKIFETGHLDTLQAQINRWLESPEGKVIEIVSQSLSVGQKEIPGGVSLKNSTIFAVIMIYRKK